MNDFNKLLYTKISEVNFEAAFDNILSICPLGRQLESSKLKNIKSSQHSYIAGAQLYRLLSSNDFGFDHDTIINLQFAKDIHGKPYLVDYPNINFNISHSNDYVICAVSNRTVIGCDVEVHRDKTDIIKIAKRFFEEEEYNNLLSIADRKCQLNMFYRYWTGKESYIKTSGIGLSGGLEYFHLDIPGNIGDIYQCENIYLKEFDIDCNYSFTIAGYDRKSIDDFVAQKAYF